MAACFGFAHLPTQILTQTKPQFRSAVLLCSYAFLPTWGYSNICLIDMKLKLKDYCFSIRDVEGKGEKKRKNLNSVFPNPSCFRHSFPEIVN